VREARLQWRNGGRDRHLTGGPALWVRMDEEEEIAFDFDEPDELAHAYASSQ
jgi:hypothetical protein